MCPLTKFGGGLQLLHEAQEDAVMWLESSIYSIHEMAEIINLFY